MRGIVVSCLVVLFMAQLFQQSAIYLHYVVNKDYIVEFLCINKERPELNCDGKCFLMQQLKELGYDDGLMRDFPVVESSAIDLFHPTAVHLPDHYLDYLVTLISRAVADYSLELIPSIFRPPEGDMS